MSLEFLDAPKDDQVHTVPGESYKIVADLLERQDQVLNDLEGLNDRIEEAIRDMLPPVDSEDQELPSNAQQASQVAA